MISVYPHQPGHAGGVTSEGAAQLAEKNAEVTREQILSLLLTADDLAAIIRKDVHDVRSRCSELKAGGSIFESGARRTNARGIAVKVWTTRRPAL